MKISLIIACTNAVLRFTTPAGEGSYYLLSSCLDRPGVLKVEASGHVTIRSHVTVTLPCDGQGKMFYTQWKTNGQ